MFCSEAPLWSSTSHPGELMPNCDNYHAQWLGRQATDCGLAKATMGSLSDSIPLTLPNLITEFVMFKKRHPKVGARPGTLVIPANALPSRVRIVQYTADFVREEVIEDVTHIKQHLAEAEVTWIDVCGLGDAATLRQLAKLFAIHPLAMEDIVNIPQRPKSERHGDQQLIICRAVSMANQAMGKDEQVSILLGPNYVITFQEDYSDPLDAVRQRIHIVDSHLRQNGADYLAYAVLDAIVDGYYPVLEVLSERLEQLEDQAIERPHPALLQQLNIIRRRVSRLRRAVWPKRELIRSLIHDENSLIGDETRLFLRDTYDHALQVSEVVDICRESVASLANTYISAVGHRSNEVMKVLTIMSSIFVPLTFIAGVYGMNFEYMPELQMRWAYPLVWLTMLGCVSGMLFFFYRRGWIGGRIARQSFSELLAGKPMDATSSSQTQRGEQIVRMEDHSYASRRSTATMGGAAQAQESPMRVRRAS